MKTIKVSDMTYFLGLDIGTTNIKCVRLNVVTGRNDAISIRPTPVHHPHPEQSEHDPEALWRAAVECISEVAVDYQIEGLGISGFAEAGLPIDKSGNALYPIIAWYDRRSEAQATWLESQFSLEELYRITGQIVSPSFGLTKWMWFRDTLPALAENTVKWLSIPDYLVWRLTGEQATDYTIASRTLLFDQNSLRWSQEMLDLGAIRNDQLPEVFPSGSLVGRVSDDTAKVADLLPGTPCFLGGHDHLCAALAAGANQPGTIVDSSGTAQAIFATLPSFIPDSRIPQRGYVCYAHVVPGFYVIKGGLKAAGGAIEWLTQQVAGLDTLNNELPYSRLEIAAQSGVGKQLGPFWLPHFIGSGTPHRNRYSQAAMAGLQLHHTQGDLFRALLEALAFWTRENIEEMQEICNQTIRQVIVLGGTTRIKLLSQLKADIINQPIFIPNVPEASATGAALLAAVGKGYFLSIDEAVKSLKYDHIIVSPNIENVDWYARIYEQAYKPLYQALEAMNLDLYNLQKMYD